MIRYALVTVTLLVTGDGRLGSSQRQRSVFGE